MGGMRVGCIVIIDAPPTACCVACRMTIAAREGGGEKGYRMRSLLLGVEKQDSCLTLSGFSECISAGIKCRKGLQCSEVSEKEEEKIRYLYKV